MSIQPHDRILVTGGAGFIGSHLVEQLVLLGAQVTVVDNLATGRLSNLGQVMSQIEFCQADLGQLLQEQHLNVEQYGYIFHLAANPYIPPSVENPAYDYETNLRNTFWLLETLRLAAQRPRLINISSAAVYGNPATIPIREGDPTVPISPYGVSKLAGERYLAVYSQLYGLWAASVRLFSVYGPRQQKQVVFDLVRQLKANPSTLQVLGDGTQARDFAYVADVVRALLLVASQAPGQGQVYNVASGETSTIASLVKVLCQVQGVSPSVVYSGTIRPGDAERWVVDMTALGRLGYTAQVPLHEGLKLTKAWFDEQFR